MRTIGLASIVVMALGCSPAAAPPVRATRGPDAIAVAEDPGAGSSAAQEPGFELVPLPSTTIGDVTAPCSQPVPIKVGDSGQLRHVVTGAVVGVRRSFGLGFGPSGGMILWERDDASYAARRLDAQGQPEGQELSIPLVGAPLIARPTVDGGVFVVMQCPSFRRTPDCSTHYTAVLLDREGGIVASAAVDEREEPILDGMSRGPSGGARLYFGGMPRSDDPLTVIDVVFRGGRLEQSVRQLERSARDWGAGRPEVVELHPDGEDLALWVSSEAPPVIVGPNAARSLAGTPLEEVRSSLTLPVPVRALGPGVVALVEEAGVRAIDLRTGEVRPAPDSSAHVSWVQDLVQGTPWMLVVSPTGPIAGLGVRAPVPSPERWQAIGSLLVMASLDQDGVWITPVRCSR